MKSNQDFISTKKIDLKIFRDNGHAWIAAPRSLLRELSLENSVSEFSYQNGPTVYLEEDCDGAVLVRELEADGYAIAFSEVVVEGDSTIRQYERYSREGAS